jgi:predicted RNA binding protein with dsRBD fold (UPF0201 family)
MSEVKIIVKALLNETEDPEKVKSAITNIFGQVELNYHDSHGSTTVVGESDGLESLRKLKDRIARDRIRDAVRSMLTHWAADEDNLEFQLNRQAAYAGHVSIYHANKAPLGPIEVKITGQEDKVIDFLCSKT